MSSRNSLVLVVLLLVVIAAAAAWYRSSTGPIISRSTPEPRPRVSSPVPTTLTASPSPVAATPSPTAVKSPLASTATIGIDETGFTPDQVMVAPGTTVTFVNNGQAPHWPASDAHPTHTQLPGFDAKHALQTGEEYSFTFTTTGAWGFHDHLNPNLTGTVIVAVK